MNHHEFASGAKKPDILFIAVEDTEAKLLSCYGGPAKTPNLEKLAARGVIFDHAYCSVPLCNPARAAVITGLRPPSTNTLRNFHDWRLRMPQEAKSLPEFMQANGYQTINVGKVVHGEESFKGEATPESHQRQVAMWDILLNPPLKQMPPGGKRPKNPAPPIVGADADAIQGERYVHRACVWGDSGLTRDEDRDAVTARAAVEELAKPHDKPLFFGVGFVMPHYDLRCPQEYLDMYPPEKVELPPPPKTDMSFLYGPYNKIEHNWLTDEEKREIRAAYWANISAMDYAVGLLLEGLEKSGKADNTLVVLWIDHGFQMGENNLWHKTMLFEEGCRVPLIIAGPGVPQGVRCDRLVETVDLYPTIADYCGLKPPAYLDSTSMLPLLRDPNRPWKKAAFSWCQELDNLSMRTERWRYSEWGAPHHIAVLYDEQNDPRELENLADKPEYRQTVAQLHEQLRQGWKAALPD